VPKKDFGVWQSLMRQTPVLARCDDLEGLAVTADQQAKPEIRNGRTVNDPPVGKAMAAPTLPARCKGLWIVSWGYCGWWL
jgi:hypothetical protein